MREAASVWSENFQWQADMQGNQLSFSLKHTYSVPVNSFKQGVRICICCDGGRLGLNGLPSNTVQKWVLHEKRLRIF